MELKVGREYIHFTDGYKSRILSYNVIGEEIVVSWVCEKYGNKIVRYKSEKNLAWGDMRLLPPSIEYLQNINQPFGTLDEDVQEALKKYKDNLVRLDIFGMWNKKSKGCFYKGSTYRLSPDYVEPKEENSKDITEHEKKKIITYYMKEAKNITDNMSKELVSFIAKLLLELEENNCLHVLNKTTERD